MTATAIMGFFFQYLECVKDVCASVVVLILIFILFIAVPAGIIIGLAYFVAKLISLIT